MALLDRLARLQLIVVTGKGGVGKTTLAVGLARVLADAGRRVMLLEADPRESVHHLLDVPPSDGEPVVADTNLVTLNVRPQAVLDALVRDRVKVGFVVDRVLASPVYQHFTAAAPGLKEMAVLGYAYAAATGSGTEDGPAVDVAILDAPASGHGFSWLEAPGLAADVLGDGPVARLGQELAGFIADPERCGVVVVTAAEEMPTREAIELIELMDRRMSRRPEMLVVNGTYPEPASDDAEHDGSWVDLWHERREVNRVELRRLERAWSGPRVELPLMVHEDGPALVAELRRRLGDALTEEPGRVAS